MDDEFDAELLRALEESRRIYEEFELPRLSQQMQRAPSPIAISDDGSLPGPSTSAVRCAEQDPFKRPLPPVGSSDAQADELYDGSEAEGFNFKAGQDWVYPTSDKFPVRTYQRDIVEKALFQNTLVSLPTGLGKTFIAAVVMYNFYRWYPNGKIIFMAPTKPLVAQQIENCINIMGIPESHTAEMTGALASKHRAGIWKEKRVFFLTPQVVQNDLSASICPANAVKCVVIDEAHRALGDHAYAQVIKLLNSYEARFRVLALSATPGSDLEAVQKVVSNLMISHIEVRTEESPDIVKYTHERSVELMVVDPGPTINRIRLKLIAIAAEYAKPLQQRKLLFGNIANMAKFTVLKEWESFRQEKTNTVDPMQLNRIHTDFSIVHSCLLGLELLQNYGLRLLLKNLKGVLEKQDSAAKRLAVNGDLRELMEEIEIVLNPIEIDCEENQEGLTKRHIYGHPKLDRLQEVVVSHFETFHKKDEATRAIVFCEYREGVIEICDMLKNFQPLVKPVAFMGQSTGKTSKGISQKQQLEIMDKFRLGIYNTLVSTSVGEEGLDIGEVDLIICFDAKNSPIRQVQRCGRTGRKREGRIIMLVTRGKEEMKYNLGLFKKKNVRAVLLNRDNLANHLLEEAPRMLPPGVQPKYTEIKVAPAANKKPKQAQQDLRKMFLKRPAGSNAGTSKPATANRPTLGKSPFLSENDFEELKLTWNTLDCCIFNRIPERTELWAKEPDDCENHCSSVNNVDLGMYIEFMRYPQRTHLVENSSDSLLLSDLLLWADDRRDNDENVDSKGLSSQVTSTQLWPTKAKKRGRQPMVESKQAIPPKKRGRPKKGESIRSHFLPKDNTSPDAEEAQPVKPKSKPLFIEDDEDLSQGVLFSQASKVRSPSPIDVPTIADSSILDENTSVGLRHDVIEIESDEDENILDISTASGYAYLSSQPTRQELYRDLSKALKRQLDDEEEDECIICDTLFLCKSLNNLVLGRKVKKSPFQTWDNISRSLDEALTLAPLLTKEDLMKYNKVENDSPIMASLMPRHEIFAEDDTCGGLLCGGMGDLSPPRSTSPPNRKLTPLLNNYSGFQKLANNEDSKMSSKSNVKNEVPFVSLTPKRGPPVHSNRSPLMVLNDKSVNSADKSQIKNEIPSPCFNPKNEQKPKDDSFVQNHFDDASFDFLGLSKIEDLFGSQEEKIGEDNNTSHINLSLTKSPKKTATLESKGEERKNKNHGHDTPQKSTGSRNMDSACFSPGKSNELILNHKEIFNTNDVTPKKGSSVVATQVSPILCSQASNKPRLARRRHKESISSQSSVKNNSSDIGNNINSKISLNQVPDEEVTSSSQLNISCRETNPFDVNFDIFDDSLFPLLDEENSGKSNVNDALKEAVRKKALEVQCKKVETSYTQKLNKLCDTSMGGLTQILEMYDEKEKSPDCKIERADSLPMLEETQAFYPAYHDDPKIEGNNENDVASGESEDLFADCDDSVFCRVDSTVSPPEKAFSLPNESINTEVGMLDKCIIISDESKCEDKPQVRQQEDSEDEVIPTSQDNRSPSPIFKPSQIAKRPSKLSLKKKKDDTSAPVMNIPTEGIDANVKSSSENVCKQIPPLEGMQPDTNDNMMADLSMFGDEFNNSWLYSQEDKQRADNTKDPDEANNKVDYTVTGSENSGQCLKDKTLNSSKDVRAARDSSPENDLELAFARLDEKIIQQRKSLSSSTPKVSKGSSKLQMQQPQMKNNFTFKRKLSLKNLKQPSNPAEMKNNKFSLNKVLEKENPPVQTTSAKNSVLNLSEFCDDSLLNELDDIIAGGKNVVSDNEVAKRTMLKAAQNTHSPEKAMGGLNSVEDTDIKRKPSLVKRKSNPNPDCGNRDSNNVPTASTSEFRKVIDVIELLSSDDESFVQNKKGKKSTLNITSSSEEGFMQKVVSRKSTVDQKRKRVLDSSTSSEEHVNNGRRYSKQPRKEINSFCRSDKNQSLDLSAFCDDSLLDPLMHDEEEIKDTGRVQRPVHVLSSCDEDDDVFVRKDKKKNNIKQAEHILSSDDDTGVQRDVKKTRRKKKGSKKGNGFIMSEADESDDGLRSSSDGESTTLDELDSSFINDSQPDASQSVVDIHDKYLQAVRSPAGGVGRFKIPSKLRNMDVNVYSQYPNQEELDQTYANDSFCVDDEPTQYEPEMSLLEIAEARLKAERREKRKLKKASKEDKSPDGNRKRIESRLGSDDSGEEVLQRKRKRLKRIKVLEETLSDDEGQAALPIARQNNQVPGCKSLEAFGNLTGPKNEEINEDLDDLARLLDDDIDFSAIPDIPECLPTVVEPPCNNSSIKFVKKTPFKWSVGSANVNPTSSLNMGGNMSGKQTPQNSSKQPFTSHGSGIFACTSSNQLSSIQKQAPLAGPSSSVKTANKGHSSKILVIASSRQIASSPDVLRVLRVNYHIIIVPHAGLDADFILSWRLGVTRIFASDLKDRKRLEEISKKLKLGYIKPHLIIEKDRIKSLSDLQKKGKRGGKAVLPPILNVPSSSRLSPWTTAGSCANAALLRQAGIQLLFSQNFDETAGLLAKLSKKESSEGHGIPELVQNVSDEVEARIQFFALLPGINYALALKLLLKFSSLSEFFARCSSVSTIANALGVDTDTARKIHRLLSEVHLNP